MGKMIAFWSPVRGVSKVTSSLCAVMISFAMQYPQYEIAFSSVGKDDTSLEDGLGNYGKWPEREGLYNRSGVAALLQNCKQKDMNTVRIRRCALPLFLPSMSLFPGLHQEERMIHGHEADFLEKYIITECLHKEYDLLCLDLCGGKYEKSLEYMQLSDCVIIVLPQNPSVWHMYQRDYGKCLEELQKGILFGGYIPLSKYGVAQYERNYRAKGENILGSVPLNEGYMDAVADGKTVEYFFRNEKAGKRDSNYEFMESTKKAAKKLHDFVFV